jgi:F-type H+-transporting ATPase subunit b
MPLTAVLAGGSVVDLDATVLVQLAAFLLLFLLLRTLLFKPLSALLQERERCTEGDVKEARRRQADAEQKMQKYERELERIRIKASHEREGLRDEGRAREREILANARREADAVIENGRKTMEKQAAEVRAGMEKEIEALSGAIASRVLGRRAA